MKNGKHLSHLLLSLFLDLLFSEFSWWFFAGSVDAFSAMLSLLHFVLTLSILVKILLPGIVNINLFKSSFV